MSQTIDQVYRDFNTMGVPTSGDHWPDKKEIRALLKMIQNSGGQAVTRNTLTALQAVTPPNENYMGIVLTGAGAGYYSRVSGTWVFGRGFPDTFAKVTLSGSGTAQTGVVNAGINPASIEVFFAKVITPNTGAMTLSIGGETAREVVNLAGNALAAGEWTGVVMFFLNGDGDYQLLIDAGAAASAAASATLASEWAGEAEDARDEAMAVAPGTWQALRDETVAARDASVAARDASIVNAQTYATEALGRAAVADGATFDVQGSGDVASYRYRRTSSSASTLIASFPSASAVSALETAEVLQFQQPNLVPDDINTQTFAGDFLGGQALLVPTTYNGRPCWSLPVTGATSQTNSTVTFSYPAASFGSEVSASVLVNGATAAGAGATSPEVRVMLRQIDAGGAEILAARQQVVLAAGEAIGERRVKFSGVTKHVNAANIWLSVICGNVGGATPRTVYFSELLVASGRSATFRVQSVTTNVPNLLPNTNWDFNSSLSAGTAAVETEGGFTVLRLLPPSASPYRSYVLPATGDLAPGKSVQFLAEVLTDAPANEAEIALLFRDANGTELASERVVARPSTALSDWTLLRVRKSVIPASAASIQFRFTWFRASGNGTVVKFRRPAVTWNTDGKILARNVFPVPAGAPGATTVYMDPTSGDDAGSGASTSPIRTFDRALDITGGVGTILLATGVHDMAASNQLDLSRVKDITLIGGSGASPGFARSVCRYGIKLTGITKTAGQTKVYQSSVDLSGDVPNFLWLDGVPDARTLITPERAHVGTKGRQYRLEHTRIERTGTVDAQSPDKATALAEIDSSSDPRFWYSQTENVVYFSIPGGADATASNVYASRSNYLTKNAPALFGAYSGGGRLVMIDIDSRYAGNSMRGLAYLEARNCAVLGSPTNGWDIAGKALTVGCEAAGSGSAATNGGDGFNCHDEGDWEHRHCWSHDNYDDGWSTHENAREYGLNPIAENNHGSGLTPAYGCQAVYLNPLTVENALLSHRFGRIGKRGGVDCHQGPSGGADGGIYTSVEVYGGVSIRDRNGFVDNKTFNSSQEAYMKAFNCLSVDPVEYGIACQTFGNCRHQGSGTAKHPSAGGVGVLNGSLVV